MRCIYCLETRNPAKGRAHVFPEAVWPDGTTLPRGSVCDPCNNYLGKLDESLISHPWIALALQFHGMPGKKGKARDRVGFVDRVVHPGGITLPCPEPKPEFDNAGVRTGRTVSILYPKNFSAFKFRRALHHVAFNLVAQADGVDRVYGEEFHEARRYIRKPRKTEEWPIGQYAMALDQIPKKVLGGLYRSEVDEYVGLRFYSVTFFVDLLRRGDFRLFLKDYQPAGTVMLEPGLEFPKYRPSGKKLYRFTIFPDS